MNLSKVVEREKDFYFLFIFQNYGNIFYSGSRGWECKALPKLQPQVGKVFIHPTPPSQAGCDTRSIFKHSTADLNSEYSFS